MIRPVSLADAPRIAEIYNRFVLETTVSFEEEPLTVSQMEERIRAFSTNGSYSVYEVDGRVEGFCYAHPWKERPSYRHTLEVTIYLTEACQGKGVGTELMHRLIDHCRTIPAKALIACITAENEASVKFHAKMGFEKVSHFRAVGFKQGRWLDVVDMELLL